MRTIIELHTTQVQALDSYCAAEKVSRTEAIRRAVDSFLPSQGNHKRDITQDPAFGLWKRKKIDGLKLQRTLRDEWDR